MGLTSFRVSYSHTFPPKSKPTRGKGVSSLKSNIPRETSAEFLLHTFRQVLEKIQKLDASIDVLKGVLVGLVEREQGTEATAAFLSKWSEAERSVLAKNRSELDQTMDSLRRVLMRGSLPDA